MAVLWNYSLSFHLSPHSCAGLKWTLSDVYQDTHACMHHTVINMRIVSRAIILKQHPNFLADSMDDEPAEAAQ